MDYLRNIGKGALMRYLALDRLLSGPIFYDLKGLTERVNDMLGGATYVSSSTIRDDLVFMESSEGFRAPIIRVQDGHYKLIRYEDLDFTILNRPLTNQQSQLLGRAIAMLGEIKGLPTFRWLEPMVAVLKNEFFLDGTPRGTVMMAQNENLTGLEWFGQLHEAIVSKVVLELTYQRFGTPKSKERIIHPYQLKQYNNRWFLVGMDPVNRPRHKYVVVPLDRIKAVHPRPNEQYIPKEEGDEDFRDYFEHIVGVSLLPDGKHSRVIPVVLRVWYPAVWYMETKPIHWTQKEIFDSAHPDKYPDSPYALMRQPEQPEDGKNLNYKVFTLEVIPNEELVQQLMVYGDQLEVLEPDWVKTKLIKRAIDILDRHGIKLRYAEEEQ